MLVSQLTAVELRRRLAGDGLGLRTGPIAFRLRTDVAAVVEGLQTLYADYPVVGDDGFCDHALDVHRVRGLRRWVRPQVRASHDHAPIFEPMPLGHAAPLLEWAMNWCVSAHAHQYLVMHAAVIERDGRAAILPAPPGSGKSTLCAALIHRGWRLMSDELALLAPAEGTLHALARPVSLKNASIDIIGRFAPGAVFGRAAHDTAKGTIAQLKAPVDHVRRVAEAARPRWVIFPRWMAGAPTTLVPRGKPETVMAISRNLFNFGISGRPGYQALLEAITASDCFDFSYSHLDDAVRVFEALAATSA